MLPIELEPEQNPPLKADRRSTLKKLSQRRFDLLVVGATALAREAIRLASYNNLSTAYLCNDDFVSRDNTRIAISEILSARYEGCVDLNHVSILGVTHSDAGNSQISAECKLSGEKFVIKAGAIINETNQPLQTIAIRSREKFDNTERPTELFNKVRTEQPAIFRFTAGRLRRLSASDAAIKLLRTIVDQAGARTQIARTSSSPLIDALVDGTQLAKEKINDFIRAGSACNIDLDILQHAIDRFGTRVAQILLLPEWNKILKADKSNSFLHGEFHLSLLTEHPANVAELLERRLFLTINRESLRIEHNLTELSALFEQLQHLNSF